MSRGWGNTRTEGALLYTWTPLVRDNESFKEVRMYSILQRSNVILSVVWLVPLVWSVSDIPSGSMDANDLSV